MAISQIGANNIILAVVFYTIATVAVGLRLYSRRLTKKKLALDDYAACIALFWLWSFFATLTVSITMGGMGYHVSQLSDPQGQLTIMLKSLVALQLTWSLTNCFVKISICFLYISIFRLKSFRIAAYACIGLSIAYLVLVILETFLTCKPFAANWDQTIPGAVCGNKDAAYEAVGIVNLLTDFFIIVLPMPVLWGLQLPVGKKIGLSATFGIGLVICVISALRIVSLATWNFSDFTYGIGYVAYWSLLEPGLGVTCCCIPVLQPVISKVTGSTMFSRRSQGPSGKFYGHNISKDLEAPGNGKFERVDDGSYPLTNVSNEYESESHEEQITPHNARAVPNRSRRDITITHDYTVTTQ